jgi:hypothetical protein
MTIKRAYSICIGRKLLNGRTPDHPKCLARWGVGPQYYALSKISRVKFAFNQPVTAVGF